MTTISIHSRSLTTDSSKRVPSNSNELYSLHRYSDSSNTAIDIFASRDRLANNLSRSTRSRPEVIRRLNGFFVQREGDEARVAFVEQGEVFHYMLPFKEFESAGITMENQPFEMDELSMSVDGVFLKGYRFRPMATAKDCVTESLELDPERKKKVEFINSVFGKRGGC